MSSSSNIMPPVQPSTSGTPDLTSELQSKVAELKKKVTELASDKTQRTASHLLNWNGQFYRYTLSEMTDDDASPAKSPILLTQKQWDFADSLMQETLTKVHEAYQNTFHPGIASFNLNMESETGITVTTPEAGTSNNKTPSPIKITGKYDKEISKIFVNSIESFNVNQAPTPITPVAPDASSSASSQTSNDEQPRSSQEPLHSITLTPSSSPATPSLLAQPANNGTQLLAKEEAPDISSLPPIGIKNSNLDCFFISIFQSIFATNQQLLNILWTATKAERSDTRKDKYNKKIIRNFIIKYFDYQKKSKQVNSVTIDEEETKNFRKAFCTLFKLDKLELGQQDATELLTLFFSNQKISPQLLDVQEIQHNYFNKNKQNIVTLASHKDGSYDENPASVNVYTDGEDSWYAASSAQGSGRIEVNIEQNKSLTEIFLGGLSASPLDKTYNCTTREDLNQQHLNDWKNWVTIYNKATTEERKTLLARKPQMPTRSFPIKRTRNLFVSPPPRLIFALKRFKFVNPQKTIKDETPIKVESTLILPKSYIEASDKDADTVYELQSFIVHIGSSPRCGHYVAYRKIGGKYYKCDDGIIEEVLGERAFLKDAENAYQLLYTPKARK